MKAWRIGCNWMVASIVGSTALVGIVFYIGAFFVSGTSQRFDLGYIGERLIGLIVAVAAILAVVACGKRQESLAVVARTTNALALIGFAGWFLLSMFHDRNGPCSTRYSACR